MASYADPVRHVAPATPAMTNDNLLAFSFPAICRKKVTAAFDGGAITSGGGVMLLSMAERRLRIAERLRNAFPIAALLCASHIRSPT